MSIKKFFLVLFFGCFSNHIFSQSNNFYSSSNISSMLEKLDVFGSANISSDLDVGGNLHDKLLHPQSKIH